MVSDNFLCYLCFYLIPNQSYNRIVLGFVCISMYGMCRTEWSLLNYILSAIIKNLYVVHIHTNWIKLFVIKSYLFGYHFIYIHLQHTTLTHFLWGNIFSCLKISILVIRELVWFIITQATLGYIAVLVVLFGFASTDSGSKLVP